MAPNPPSLHPLLARQLARAGVVDSTRLPEPAAWQQLLKHIHRSYQAADQDRYTLERSMQISSQEMQAAEARLAEEARKLRAIVGAIGDGLCVLDAEERVRFANGESEAMLGWTVAELTDMVLLELLTDTGIDAANGTRSYFEGLRQRGIVRAEAARIRCRTGTLPVSFVLSPILEADRIQGAVLVFRDMTEAHRNREQLEKALTSAEHATKVKSEFLATMSHEIRTPMNGVLGMISLLGETSLTSVQQDYVEIASRSGNALLAVINDILDFSKIEAGKLELESVDFELEQVVDEVVELFAETAAARGLGFDCKIDRDVPRYVRGDPGRLRQVLTNLVSNALKFTARGSVTVCVQRPAHADPALVRFAVTDTGLGIDQTKRGRLFQPFSQADSSTTREFGGTGLGLAICRRLTELQGGSIGVHSEPGQGSSFWFTARLLAEATPPGPAAIGDQLQVLLLRGADTALGTLQARLEALGGTVHVVADVATALARLPQLVRGHRLLVLPLAADCADALDALAQLPDAEDVRAIVTGTDVRGCGEALTSHPRFGGLLRLPVRGQALRDCLLRVIDHRPAADRIPRQRLQQRGPSTRVLVVEDNVVNQKVACHMLQRLGHEVQVAANGLEALAALQRTAFDLVLMDCQMPEMDGFEATRRIRATESPLQRLPIIAVTANAMKGDREQCLAAGMDGYLTKPVRIAELLQTLDRFFPAVVRP